MLCVFICICFAPLPFPLPTPLLAGAAYDALVDEFMSEMRSWQPRCLVQFEDFGNTNAFRILERYRRVQPCFNDDIQVGRGTRDPPIYILKCTTHVPCTFFHTS